MGESRYSKDTLVGWLILSLIVPILTFYCLVLTGCISSSPGLSQLYLMGITTAKDEEIRVGYFGICAISKNQTNCGPTNAVIRSSPVFFDENARTRELSAVVSDLQTKINPPLIAVAGALFLAAIVARLSLAHTTKSDADNRFRRIIIIYRLYIGLVTLSAFLLFGEAIACTEMVAGAKYILKQGAEVSKFDLNEGSPLISLQWATFAIQAVFSIVTTAKILKEYGNYD